MKKIILITIVLLISGTIQCFSQAKTIKGTVVGFKKYPLKNVSIYTKKSKQKTVTDSLGHFEIACKSKDLIFFKAAGFHLDAIKLKTNDTIFLNMIYTEKGNSYNQVIKGEHLNKKILDYCISNLSEDNNNYDRLQTVFDVIQYEYPNAKINENPDSSFGVSGPQVVLNAKGVSTFIASPYALLVVDGQVVNDISNIATQQIKKLKVLTGNEASHWGMRGSNGAVEIDLKYK